MINHAVPYNPITLSTAMRWQVEGEGDEKWKITYSGDRTGMTGGPRQQSEKPWQDGTGRTLRLGQPNAGQHGLSAGTGIHRQKVRSQNVRPETSGDKTSVAIKRPGWQNVVVTKTSVAAKSIMTKRPGKKRRLRKPSVRTFFVNVLWSNNLIIA